MKLILFILLFTLQIFSQDITIKQFWQTDKRKHLGASAVIATTFTALAKNNGSSNIESFFIGIGSTLLIGIAKEYLDGKNPLHHTEDVNDMYTDTIGAVLGSTLAVSFSWKF